MLPYQIDIYRNENTVVLHRFRKKRTKMMPKFAYCIIFGFLGIIILIAICIVNICAGLIMSVFFVLVYILKLSTETRWEILRIDKDWIRYDYCNGFGFRISKQQHREAETVAGYSNYPIKKGFINFVKIRNGEQQTALEVFSETRAKWVTEEVQRFLDENPPDENLRQELPSNEPLPKARWFDADAGQCLIERQEFNGVPLHRLPTWQKNIDEKTSDYSKQGVLRVRCEHCRRLIPMENVDAKHAIAGCPDCKTLYEIPSFKQTEPTTWMRAKVFRDGETLHIRQSLFGWAPILWITILFTLSVIAGLFGICYKILAHARETLTPQQFDEYLYNYIGASHVNPLMIFMGITAVLIFLLFFVVRLFFSRYRLEITPETCIFEKSYLFFRQRMEIPRTDLRKYLLSKQNVNFGKLIYRNGYFSIDEGYRLQGIINHYLLTVPPLEQKYFEPNDSSIEFGSLGGEESDCIKVELLDVSAGSFLPFENAMQEIGTENETDRILLRSPKADLGSTGRVTFEKTDTKIDLQIGKETSNEAYAGFWILSVLFGSLIGFYFLEGLYIVILDFTFPQEDTPAGAIVGLVSSIIFGTAGLFSIFAVIDTYRNFKAEWTLRFDAEKLELIRRYRHWENRQTVERKDMVVAKIKCYRSLGWFAKIPSLLQPGRITLLLRDDRIFGLPRFPHQYDKSFSQGLVNELNNWIIRK